MEEKVLEHVLVKIVMCFGPLPASAASPVLVVGCRLQYSHSHVQKYLNPEAMFALQVEDRAPVLA